MSGEECHFPSVNDCGHKCSLCPDNVPDIAQREVSGGSQHVASWSYRNDPYYFILFALYLLY